jgi:hypothetical protein
MSCSTAAASSCATAARCWHCAGATSAIAIRNSGRGGILFGEYGRYIDQLSPTALAAGATGSELDRFGLGVVQEIDAASMSVWIKYREQAADVSGLALDLDEFRYVSTGALINF